MSKKISAKYPYRSGASSQLDQLHFRQDGSQAWPLHQVPCPQQGRRPHLEEQPLQNRSHWIRDVRANPENRNLWFTRKNDLVIRKVAAIYVPVKNYALNFICLSFGSY